MAMFGKALGNGYAITAIIGKSSVMEAAQTSFISSTFGSNVHSPAALKHLVMERNAHGACYCYWRVDKETLAGACR